MSDYTYNTEHSRFLIEVRKVPYLLRALEAHAKEVAGEDVHFDNPWDAFHYFGFGCTESEGGPGEGEVGNIIDLFLEDPTVREPEMTFMTNVIAPFVFEGSYLVFAFGGGDSLWAISYEKDKETDLVKGSESNIATVLDDDMVEILEAIRNQPALFAKMRVKYASYYINTQLDQKDNGGKS